MEGMENFMLIDFLNHLSLCCVIKHTAIGILWFELGKMFINW